ncbi:unnamed protein product [Ectocarpus sp. 12 AP-2014]
MVGRRAEGRAAQSPENSIRRKYMFFFKSDQRTANFPGCRVQNGGAHRQQHLYSCTHTHAGSFALGQERDRADTTTHRSPLRWLPDAPGWCLFTASFGLEHPSGAMSSQRRRAVSRWIFEFEYLNCSIENRRGRRVGQLGKYELRSSAPRAASFAADSQRHHRSRASCLHERCA